MRAKHNPRALYDCGACKFNWNCGDLCACNLRRMKDRNGKPFQNPSLARQKEINEKRMEANLSIEFPFIVETS